MTAYIMSRARIPWPYHSTKVTFNKTFRIFHLSSSKLNLIYFTLVNDTTYPSWSNSILEEAIVVRGEIVYGRMKIGDDLVCAFFFWNSEQSLVLMNVSLFYNMISNNQKSFVSVFKMYRKCVQGYRFSCHVMSAVSF